MTRRAEPLRKLSGGRASGRWLEAMGSADGEDLLDVVAAVDELESAPMIDVQGAEDGMRGEA